MRGYLNEPRGHPKITLDRRLKNYSGMYDPFSNKLYLGLCDDEKEVITTLKHELVHWAHDMFLKEWYIDLYLDDLDEDDETTVTERLARWLE